MGKILIIYGTTEGQTKKIANAMAEELRKSAHRVEIVDAHDIPDSLRVDDFDGVIMGASVHGSNYPTHFRKWTRANAKKLGQKPSAFFSVCLGILQKDNPKVQAEERKIVNNFLDWSGWRPDVWTILPGALVYSKYGWIKRQIMKAIARRAGGDTDTTRDYEYTNWDDVRRFAQQFSQSTTRPPTTSPSH